jgi:hypothetical protein
MIFIIRETNKERKKERKKERRERVFKEKVLVMCEPVKID